MHATDGCRVASPLTIDTKVTVSLVDETDLPGPAILGSRPRITVESIRGELVDMRHDSGVALL